MVIESIPSWIKTFGYALALSTSFELLYYLRSLQKFQEQNKTEEEELDVIFFPDETVACDAHFSYGCSNKSCWYSHEETSTMKVTQFLEKAERTLDICVYCIASQMLVDSVLKCHDQGIIVRVITDQAQALEQSAQIGRLRSAGVEVRTNDTTFFMHHKFAIVDRKDLMTGSFNWSRNATLGNNENVLFIKKKRVTEKYATVFESLWVKYSPHTIG